SRLLAWHDSRWHPLKPAQINGYIRDRTQGEFTAKDFRTLRGTLIAAGTLAEFGPCATEAAGKRALSQAVKRVAEELGNTPAVARKSYIDPRVIDRYLAGQILQTRRRESAEKALCRLLA
ncbi:MAG: DNA topoisomerase IB, partial [Microbacteriaceae bacterium]